MGANEYQPVKCEGCGKTLGYIYIKLKTHFFPPMYSPRYWPLLGGQPQHEFEKTAYCETCFQKRLEEISAGKQEPQIKKDETEEPRPKSKDRSLIR